MVVIQVEKKRFKELFDASCKELELDKCLSKDRHYSSNSEYKAALNDMHRRFTYVVRTLQSKLKDAQWN